ncbi:MAG TPA: hypothetical protein VFZ83_09970, partial [Acidimicrobiia bacterium]|nr:hypothetical protein [Acidimicrobiia bacterium]
TGNQLFTQASDGIAGSPAVGRRWSEAAMFALDTNGDGRDDLSVPSYRQPVQGAAEAGVSYLLFGTGDGVTGVGSRTYSRATSGIVGPVAANTNFGQCCF